MRTFIGLNYSRRGSGRDPCSAPALSFLRYRPSMEEVLCPFERELCASLVRDAAFLSDSVRAHNNEGGTRWLNTGLLRRNSFLFGGHFLYTFRKSAGYLLLELVIGYSISDEIVFRRLGIELNKDNYIGFPCVNRYFAVKTNFCK